MWRKWHRRVNIGQKRYAIVSAIAATAVPSLVLARGHKIESVPEVPLVVPTSTESITKTKDAIALLKSVGGYADVEKAKESRNIRAGKGKMRNRRYVNRRGPLVVYATDDGIEHAFRNLPGVELVSVDRLNLLKLAPGGHLGRFVVWTKAAFEKLDAIYGTPAKPSALKKGFALPRPIMANPDLNRLINSDEVQRSVRPPKSSFSYKPLKKNPLKNLGAMLKLNPYEVQHRRSEMLAEAARVKAKAELLAKKRAAKPAAAGKGVKPKAVREVAAKFYKGLITDSLYQGDDYSAFASWLAGVKAGGEAEDE